MIRRRIGGPTGTSFLGLLAQSTAAWAAYYVLHRLYFKYTLLPESAYFRPVLVLQVVRQPGLVMTLVPLALVLLLAWRRLRWDRFEQGQKVRWFAVLLALAIAWAFSTYAYNDYFAQGHLVDRLLLVGLAILIWVHPAFVPPFLILACVIAHQFHHPITGYSWLDKRILFDALILLQAMLFLSLIRRQSLVLYLGLCICLLAANYFIPGVGKLQINWLAHDRLFNLAVAAYLNGWVAHVDQARLLGWVAALEPFNTFALMATLIIELGSLFIFWRRWTLVALVLASVALHLGIFIASGICFWKWVVFNVVALVILLRMDRAATAFLFTRRFFLVSMILIAASPLYAEPTWLMWFDTDLNTTYELEAVGASGRVYPVARASMAPYDLLFAQNRFWYLSDEKSLVGTYGATDNPEINLRLRDVLDRKSLEALTESLGRNRYHAASAQAFDRFIQTRFRNLNRSPDPPAPLAKLAAPHHIWSEWPPGAYRSQEPVRSVRVRSLNRLYRDHRIVLLDDRIIREISIPD